MSTTAEKTDGRKHAVRVRVNDDELQFIQQVAAAEDRTISGVLRLALREFHERRIQEASA